MKTVYKLDIEQKKYFSSVLLMNLIINEGVEFNLCLEGDDRCLESILSKMRVDGLLDLRNDKYVPTDSGRKMLLNHKEKLSEFKSLYKVFSAVDLNEGKFAYSRYFDFDTDEEFINYIHQDNFEDLRVAVCQFKKINPLEIIFLEMVDENRFFVEGEIWQTELVFGFIWEEMLEIANSNIHISDLNEFDENGNLSFSGEQVIEIIIKEGTNVTVDLLKKQSEIDSLQQEEDEEIVEEIITEEVVEEVYVDEPYYDYNYYNCYYDPFFVSSCWLLLYY